MPTTHLKAAAGGAGGSWYVLLQGLASLVAEEYPQLHIEVVAGGGVANHTRVGSGEIPMGILNPPMTAAALAGRAPYTQAYPALRVGVTNLSVNYLHCCVEQALPLASVAAWMQHRYPLRLPVDRIGTVDRLVFQQLLAHFGVAEPTIERWGGALIPAMNYDEQLALYARSEVNALWQFMGIPSPSVQAAHALRPLKMLPFPHSFIAELERLGWTAATMPAGAYGADEEAVPTVAMATSLGFHANVPEVVVYAITSVICDHAERVRQIHPAAQHFALAGAHLHGGAPLHPGAARYFRGKGVSIS
ncbi:MAG TPA: TAXI family TRAP transporter solute-binding subunit [Candidatus Tectomicrobia bacterium]|nr:TAXI family TRAP transporter solute-binding subunit [Candidatus Tectomicrobia bacterium]